MVKPPVRRVCPFDGESDDVGEEKRESVAEGSDSQTSTTPPNSPIRPSEEGLRAPITVPILSLPPATYELGKPMQALGNVFSGIAIAATTIRVPYNRHGPATAMLMVNGDNETTGRLSKNDFSASGPVMVADLGWFQ